MAFATYIFLYQHPSFAHILNTRDIAPVKAHILQRFALLRRLTNVQHSDTDSSHTICLRQYLSQPSSAACYNHDFLVPIELPRRSPSQSLIQSAHQSKDSDACCVYACVFEVRVRVGVGEGAYAERDEPGDVWVEDGAGEDEGQ
jgi:hypothetical protein